MTGEALIHRRPQAAALFLAALAAASLGVLAPVGVAPAQEPPLTLGLHLTAPAGTQVVGTDLVAGIAPGAGPAYDPGLDARALRVGALQAWFLEADLPPAARYLSRDFRAGTGEERLEVEVATPGGALDGTVGTGAPVSVAWNPPDTGGGLCTGRTLTLEDPAAGVAVDMTAARAYAFDAPAPGAVHTLILVVGAPGTGAAAAPAPPERLLAPSRGRREVLLVWSPGAGNVAGYHVERTVRPGDPAPAFARLTDAPVATPRFVDADVGGLGTVGYRVIAVSGAGCASAPSDTLVVAP